MIVVANWRNKVILGCIFNSWYLLCKIYGLILYFLLGLTVGGSTIRQSRRGSGSTAQQYGGERSLLLKEVIHLLGTPFSKFAVILDPGMNYTVNNWFNRKIFEHDKSWAEESCLVASSKLLNEKLKVLFLGPVLLSFLGIDSKFNGLCSLSY